MQHSGEVNTDFAVEYIGTPKFKTGLQYTGIKVVRDKGENFYSISSGMYRYRVGRVLNTAGYENLYQNTDSVYYREFMKGNTAVFQKLSHAYRCFPELVDNPDYAFVQVTLAGPLTTVELERPGIKDRFRVVLSPRILDIQRMKLK